MTFGSIDKEGTPDSCSNERNVDERSMSLGFTKSLLRSLDSCFNLTLFGLPNEFSAFSGRGNSSTIKKMSDTDSMEVQFERLMSARDDLFSGNYESANGSCVSIDESIHCKQEYNWDCGVTCILMLLRFVHSVHSSDSRSTFSKHIEQLQKQWMFDRIQTKSIWTIDLIMLLDTILNDPPPRLKFPKLKETCNSLRVKYLYCTKNFGVDETYKGFNYYKHAYREDEKRVEILFSEAWKKEIQMLKISQMETEFVAGLISKQNCVAIALLDYNVLVQYSSVNEQTRIDDDNGRKDSEFSGHYVFLYGISKDPNDIANAQQRFPCAATDSSFCFVVLDPGTSQPCTFVTKEVFQKAWRSNGTDSDIIFIVVDDNQHEKLVP